MLFRQTLKPPVIFSVSVSVAWRAVIDGVLEARAGFHLKQLPLGGMSGPRMLGVVHDAVIFLLEQLQGAAHCKRHRFRFHRCEHIEEELPLNPSGCARSEVYTRYRNVYFLLIVWHLSTVHLKLIVFSSSLL